MKKYHVYALKSIKMQKEHLMNCSARGAILFFWDAMEGFVAKGIFAVSYSLRLGGSARGSLLYTLQNVFANGFKRKAFSDDSSGIDVHIGSHALVGFWIGTYLDNGRDGRAGYRPSASGVKHQMATAGYHLHDFGIVVDVGKAPARLAVRYHVHHP